MSGYGEGLYGGGILIPGVPTALEIAAETGKTVEDVDTVYASEVANQASRCRVDPYDPPLAAALTRRILRALAMKNLPLGVMQDEAGAVTLGSNDPEVRRLEGPHRRVTLG